MKTATVTAYINTGFSGINVPDSPALLENNAQRKQLSVINCLPLSGQVNVSIRVKDYPELHETDYIKMEFSGDNTTYWAKVDGYVYLSSDTVEIALTMDYWLTLGGIGNVSSISGMTKRVHIPKANDTLFAYTEPDEMINPAKTLKTVCDPKIDATNIHTGDNNGATIIISTMDLYAIGRAWATNTDDNGKIVEKCEVVGKDYTYTDPSTHQEVVEHKSVTIPKLWSAGNGVEPFNYYDFETTWKLGGAGLNELEKLIAAPYGRLEVWTPQPTKTDYYAGSYKLVNLSGVTYFDADNEWVKKGIEIVHDCGVEDCLIDQYYVPSEYITNKETYAGRIRLTSAHENAGLIIGSSDLNYEYGTYKPRNKKVYTGVCNAYTIFAKASADMQSFNPEVLGSGVSGDSPVFRLICDLRHQGGAMCTPLAVNGDVERWYTNFVKELPFQSAPIKFDGASGSTISNALMSLNLNTNRANFNQMFPNNGLSINEDEGFLSGLLGTGGSTLAGILETAVGGVLTFGTAGIGTAVGAGLMTSGLSQLVGGAADLGYQGTKGLSNRELSRSTRKEAYNAQVLEEKKGQAIRNSYVAPQIKFQQSQTLRELVGNGFIIFKYQMSDEDLERCDKLLTMYGYAHIKDLELTDLTNRPAFNYVEAGDVHITTTVPVAKWIREGAEDQLVGARIWHKMYNVSEYENNE